MAEMDQATRPIRLGIFDAVGDAERAVRALFKAGFRKEELGILCSSKYKEEFFPSLPAAVPPGAPPSAIAAGGAIGATIGGLALASTALFTGGITLLAAGAVLLGGGAIAGGFTGAMVSLGYDRTVAERYERAVHQGKILLAVEIHGAGSDLRLAEAERILRENGADVTVEVAEPI